MMVMWRSCEHVNLVLFLYLQFFTIVLLIFFYLILYAPVNNISVMLGRVFLGWTNTKQGLMCLAQGHNAVTPVRLEPTALRSRVKHSTSEPLRSLICCHAINLAYFSLTRVLRLAIGHPSSSNDHPRERSGRVLDSRPRGGRFKPHWRHCVVSLSKKH